jgi:hypothetical protein
LLDRWISNSAGCIQLLKNLVLYFEKPAAICDQQLPGISYPLPVRMA